LLTAYRTLGSAAVFQFLESKCVRSGDKRVLVTPFYTRHHNVFIKRFAYTFVIITTVTFLLSNAERTYLENTKKKKIHRNPKSQVQRNLETKIRKKIRQPMRDLALIFETLTPSELHFFKEDYVEFAIPLLSAIGRFNLNWYYEDVETTYLTVALIRAGKRYDFKRLVTNEKYRQHMIEWLVKNGIEFWTPPTLEEQKREREKIARLMNKLCDIKGELASGTK
jgi:hypothetical protein